MKARFQLLDFPESIFRSELTRITTDVKTNTGKVVSQHIKFMKDDIMVISFDYCSGIPDCRPEYLDLDFESAKILKESGINIDTANYSDWKSFYLYMKNKQ